MKTRIARHLGMLSSDGSTIIEGKITSTDLDNDINYVYREVLFPLLADKFPEDFSQPTYPQSTYVTYGTVDASSTGTQLVTTTNVFANSMEGFQVYNATDDAYATIVTYVSATTVNLDETIGNTWDGDLIYVLGNEFAFGGSMTDAKDILGVAIKYTNSATEWTVCEQVKKQDVIYEKGRYNTLNPKWYPVTIDVAGVPTQGIGIVPFPTNYDGQFQITYTERPPELDGDSKEPTLKVQGIGEPIINGVVAIGKRMQELFDEAPNFEEIDPVTGRILPKGTRALINTYRPRSRGGSRSIRLSRRWDSMRRRGI